MFGVAPVDVCGAYHDDRHAGRGVTGLGLSVKVRLQLTGHLRLHVVLKQRVFLKGDQRERMSERTSDARARAGMEQRGTVTQGWQRMSCAVCRASTLTCSIFPISSCKKMKFKASGEKLSLNCRDGGSIGRVRWVQVQVCVCVCVF